MADFKHDKSNEAVTQQGTTAPSSADSGEHVIPHGGPVGSGSFERVVIGPKIGAPRKCASGQERISKSLAARSVEIACELLGFSKDELAELLSVCDKTASVYMLEGKIKLCHWLVIKAELEANGLGDDFTRRIRLYEQALDAAERRTA
jgi:hypothetical protein